MGSTAAKFARPALLGAALTAAFGIAACSAPAHRLPRGIPPTLELARTSDFGDDSRRRDRSIARVLKTLAHRGGTEGSGITIHWHGREGIDPLDFDKFIPSSSVRRRNWRERWHEQAGVGSPLVLLREPNGKPFVGKLGAAMPVTATVEGGPSAYEITLHDSLAPGCQDELFRGQPVAHDFTAPLAYLLRRDELIPELRALLQAGRYLDQLKLYRLDPYDPDKIPVILIHGLTDNAKIWPNLINGLTGNPEVRDRYQLWIFAYPTGVPILYSAMRLRQELDAMRRYYDPDGTNPNLQKMVVAGHSMGGLLARMLISESGNAFLSWSPKPFEELQLTDEIKALAEEALVFEPLPYVGRTIFICVPHRGSDIASKKIVRNLTRAIRVPQDLKNAVLTTIKLNPEVDLVPGNFINQLNSVNDLRPDSLFMRSLDTLPIPEGVAYHSIIAVGKDGLDRPIEEADDGLVRYPSAHLEGALSELLVEDSHKIFDHPETISEVARILNLHR